MSGALTAFEIRIVFLVKDVDAAGEVLEVIGDTMDETVGDARYGATLFAGITDDTEIEILDGPILEAVADAIVAQDAVWGGDDAGG